MENKAIERLNEATKAQTSEDSFDTEKAAEDGRDTEPKEIPEESPKIKSKKGAFQETILLDVPGNPEALGEINTTLEEVPKKKSKKRKHQEINAQTDLAEDDVSVGNRTVEDSAVNSLYQSDDHISKRVRKKKSKHHDSLLSVDDYNNSISVEESSILSLDNESLVLSNQEQSKKSKKKKLKDHSDRNANERLLNGVVEEPPFTENTVLIDLGEEDGGVVEKRKKRHKKKHRRPSAIEESILESTNRGTDFASQKSLVDCLAIHTETPKQKKRKRKHLDNVQAENDDDAFKAEDRLLLPSDSQEFAEPKAKKKRKN